MDKEAAHAPVPPLLPPRPPKQRTVSVVDERPLPEVPPMKRINSVPIVNCNFKEVMKDLPELSQKPIKMPARPPPPPPPAEPEAAAPPLPPRHPLRTPPNGPPNGPPPPPLPPRSSQVIEPGIAIENIQDENSDDLKPPALPPKSNKS
jgi:hypothetical protein